MTEHTEGPVDDNVRGEGLVEPEGVNAASGEDQSPPEPAAGDVRSGGDPDSSDQMDSPANRDDIVGPPDQHAGGPGQELAVGEG